MNVWSGGIVELCIFDVNITLNSDLWKNINLLQLKQKICHLDVIQLETSARIGINQRFSVKKFENSCSSHQGFVKIRDKGKCISDHASSSNHSIYNTKMLKNVFAIKYNSFEGIKPSNVLISSIRVRIICHEMYILQNTNINFKA